MFVLVHRAPLVLGDAGALAAARMGVWEIDFARNIRPFDGKPPHQLTHFTDRIIEDFAWSHDGRRLAIARSTTTNDIVLFKGLRR